MIYCRKGVIDIIWECVITHNHISEGKVMIIRPHCHDPRKQTT